MPYLFALQMQISLTLMLLCAAGCGGSTSPAEENTSSPGRYEDLLALFEEWRGFEEPRMIGGVPDYTTPAMAAQYQELSVYRRLAGPPAGGLSPGPGRDERPGIRSPDPTALGP